MDSGIGIGGLNTSSEEFVESKFDLFSKVEYENGIKTRSTRGSYYKLRPCMIRAIPFFVKVDLLVL